MPTSFKLSIAILVTAGVAGGCAKDPQAVGAAARNEVARQQMEKDKFQDQTPVNADTRFAAGQFAEIQGDLPRAIEQYQSSLKINPKHTSALFALAALYTGQKQFTPAIDLWNRYIQATNGSAAGYSNLALTYEMAGKRSEAESAYRLGIAKDPKNEACRVNYGLMLARENRTSEATTQLQTVLTPAETHYDLASIYEAQGKTVQAKAEYQKTLEIDPAMTDAKSRLAALDQP